MLDPMSAHLACSTINIGFVPIRDKTRFDVVRMLVSFHRGQRVKWTSINHEDPFVLYCSSTGRRRASQTNLGLPASRSSMANLYIMKVSFRQSKFTLFLIVS